MNDLIPQSELDKARRRHLLRRGVLLGRPLLGPLETIVIPTYKCHYRCVFCALESEAEGKKADMPAERLHALIDDLAALDGEQVSYTGGGEPLLYKGIDELVAHTREKGIAVSICTNGDRLDAGRIDRFAKLGVHLSISLNAATPDLYAEIHPTTQPGAFERIIESLAEYVRVARREGGVGSFVSLNFVLMNGNYRQVPRMAEVARRIGASQVQFRHIQPRPVHKHLTMNPDELAEARRLVREVETDAKAAGDLTLQIMEILRMPEDKASRRIDDAGADLVRVPCIEGYLSSYVDSDGVVFPCCMRSTSITSHWMGDLNTERFVDIWYGENYRKFRREAMGIDPTAESETENSCRFCPKATQFVNAIDELAPGSYAHLYRELARELSESAKRPSRAASAADGTNLTGTGWRNDFPAHEIPASVPAGTRFAASVTVRNTGTQVWPGLAHPNAVGLGYHLLSRRNKMVRFDNNPRTYLDEDLAPGDSATLPLSIQAPDRPGKYVIELAMIQENVAWFETEGGATVRAAIRVIG